VARVTGIGGFFFRARDPDARNRWHAEHLGVVQPTGNHDDLG
jgi:glyoxylase I family protein